jgi:hypothetical protein
MAKRQSLKDQLKKAAKRRQARISTAGDVESTTPVPPSGISASRNAIVEAILFTDGSRDDINDRAVAVGLRSVLRGYPADDDPSAAIYHAVADAKADTQMQPRPMRSAIDEILQIIAAYGSDRQSPRAAITYLRTLLA